MERPSFVGSLGRWLTIYLATYAALCVAFGMLVRGDIVQMVIQEHMTLFVLTVAALSLLVTTLVDDHLNFTGRDEEDRT
jgi:hypothetical protein